MTFPGDDTKMRSLSSEFVISKIRLHVKGDEGGQKSAIDKFIELRIKFFQVSHTNSHGATMLKFF
jgi:hypothetical protein